MKISDGISEFLPPPIPGNTNEQSLKTIQATKINKRMLNVPKADDGDRNWEVETNRN